MIGKCRVSTELDSLTWIWVIGLVIGLDREFGLSVFFPFGFPAKDDVCGIRRCSHEKFPVPVLDIKIPER